jgi:hypothetical protein
VAAQDDKAVQKKDTSWSVPEAVTVPVGGTGYLAVKIDRKQIKDTVEVEVVGLPEGVKVKGKPKRTLEREDAEANFTLVSEADVKPAGDQKILVNLITTGVARPPREVKLNVVNFDLQPGSALVMGLSILAVLTLVSFCVWRVLTLPPVEVEEHLKGPLEIDTRDTQDAD